MVRTTLANIFELGCKVGQVNWPSGNFLRLLIRQSARMTLSLVVVALVTWMLPGTIARPSSSCLESRSLLQATCPHQSQSGICSMQKHIAACPSKDLGQAIPAATNDNKRSPVSYTFKSCHKFNLDVQIRV